MLLVARPLPKLARFKLSTKIIPAGAIKIPVIIEVEMYLVQLIEQPILRIPNIVYFLSIFSR